MSEKNTESKERPVFVHRPKMGDIIYSLPLIRALGGGTLLLNPESPYFPNQKFYWTKTFEWMIPYLKTLPYLDDVRVYNGEKFHVDLDNYMVGTTHLEVGDTVSIVENHFKGCEFEFNPEEDTKQWLKSVKKKGVPKVLIARSSNHRGHGTTFDFLDQYKDIAFIGTEIEYKAFISETGKDIPHYKTIDLMDLMGAISSCKLFIGNQSFPLSLAAGLRKKRIVEQALKYPNCTFGHEEEETI